MCILKDNPFEMLEEEISRGKVLGWANWKKILRILRDILAAEEKGRPFDLDNKKTVQDAMLPYVQQVMQLLETIPCEPAVVADIIQLHYRFSSYHHTMFGIKLLGYLALAAENRSAEAWPTLELMRAPYGHFDEILLRRDLSELCTDHNHDILNAVLQTGNVQFLRTLLSCGVMYVYPELYTGEQWVCFEVYDSLAHCFERANVSVEILETGFERRDDNVSGTHFRRSAMALMALYLLSQAVHPDRVEWNYLLGYRMIFESIPEPHLRSGEIRDAYKRCVAVKEPGADQFLVDRFCWAWEKVFPESKGPSAPRSLLHLSRCQVRQNLREAGTILWGVKHLCIPRSLEDYVLLK